MTETKKKAQSSPALRKGRSGMTLIWDREMKFKATEEFIEAIKNLLIAEIKMMRMVHKETADCWYCGSATIEDMANRNYLSMIFGGKDDVKWIKSNGQIFVTVP